MNDLIDLKKGQEELYKQIESYHFERYGYFGSQFPAWDYFGRINLEGRKLLKIINKTDKLK